MLRCIKGTVLGTFPLWTVRIQIRIKESDLDPYQIEKQDPDPYKSEKQDPDHKGLDLQHWWGWTLNS